MALFRFGSYVLPSLITCSTLSDLARSRSSCKKTTNCALKTIQLAAQGVKGKLLFSNVESVTFLSNMICLHNYFHLFAKIIFVP